VVAAGARRKQACAVLGLSTRTVERWRAAPGECDRRETPRHQQGNALSAAELAHLEEVMMEEKYRCLSPKQLVPVLADEGVYLASESTMYRLIRRKDLRKVRRQSRVHAARAARVHHATGPNQVWSWDITWLPSVIRGRYFYLYLVMDVWSRRIMGWQVCERERTDDAAALIRRICAERNIDPRGLVLHSDNGNPMRGNTMLITLQSLGVIASFSRPHVSDDNPYSEALFRTLKYTPAYPNCPFATIDEATNWVQRFVAWYNTTHKHSAIRFVTPDQRHSGEEQNILTRRALVYAKARRRKPHRWTQATRNWSPIGSVVLNPERTVTAPA
jgi:putative transposase